MFFNNLLNSFFYVEREITYRNNKQLKKMKTYFFLKFVHADFKMINLNF